MTQFSLLVHSSPPGADGLLVSVTPQSAGWQYVGFEVYRLGRGSRVERSTEGREVCVVVLTGRVDVAVGDREWFGVGGRESVFDGPPDAVYAPPGSSLAIAAPDDTCEVALCWAPAKRGADPALLSASHVPPFKRGSGRTERTIRHLLMEDRPADALLVSETLAPGGNWSSYHRTGTTFPAATIPCRPHPVTTSTT